MANTPYYTTQGGGTAVMSNGVLVWDEPPKDLDAESGDEVPEQWGYIGPFDPATGQIIPEDDLLEEDPW